MSTGRPVPPASVPTLTEVVNFRKGAGPQAAPVRPATPAPAPAIPTPVATVQTVPAVPAVAPKAASDAPRPAAPTAAAAPTATAVPAAPQSPVVAAAPVVKVRPVVAAPSVQIAPPPAVAVAPAPPVAALPDENELARRILTDLQRQLDLMLEVRLREALTPLLTRAADTFVRDSRKELTATLKDAVSKAVAAEIARLKNP